MAARARRLACGSSRRWTPSSSPSSRRARTGTSGASRSNDPSTAPGGALTVEDLSLGRGPRLRRRLPHPRVRRPAARRRPPPRGDRGAHLRPPARPQPSAVGDLPHPRAARRQRRAADEDPPCRRRRRLGQRDPHGPARPEPEGREIPPATRALGQDRVPGDIEMLGLEATTARPPRTPFNGPISPHRRFAFGRLSLDAVRELKATLGHTVNDVVVALCASAVRESLLARDALPGEPLVAMVPVSVPGPATRCSWPAPSSRPPTPCRSWSTAWASTSPS
jgi:Wax ester synthase-like Acyl-CoA acyltransferase domain